jgi:hypothetical protein
MSRLELALLLVFAATAGLVQHTSGITPPGATQPQGVQSDSSNPDPSNPTTSNPTTSNPTTSNPKEPLRTVDRETIAAASQIPDRVTSLAQKANSGNAPEKPSPFRISKRQEELTASTRLRFEAKRDALHEQAVQTQKGQQESRQRLRLVTVPAPSAQSAK